MLGVRSDVDSNNKSDIGTCVSHLEMSGIYFLQNLDLKKTFHKHMLIKNYIKIERPGQLLEESLPLAPIS